MLTLDTDPASVRAVLEQLQRRRPDDLVLTSSGSVIVQAAALRDGIVALKLPATGLTAAGAILRNGRSVEENLGESTEIADRILRGARPAELPVRLLMRVEVALDLRMAREIGVELPASLRLRADRVIE